MPFITRVTTTPSVAEIQRLPQIVIVDSTGPAIVIGTSPGIAMLVGEFLQGPTNAPTEITSQGNLLGIFGGVTPLLSQDGSSPPVQDGAQVGWNGNGILQLKGKTFTRLGVTRVDTEAVTADAGGTTKSQLTLTITVGAADQTTGFTNKDIVLPAGMRFGDAVIASATKLVALSQATTIPKGMAVTSNAITAHVNCFVVKEPEPVVAIAIAAIDVVIDSFIDNVDPATTVTAVNNAAAIWPPGTGTTLALRVASRYSVALTATMPGNDTTSEISIIWAARRISAVRQAVVANAINASAQGKGRIACVAAEPATATDPTSAAAGVTAAAGLAAADSIQSDRCGIVWPNTKIFSEELGSIKVLVNADGWLASILSNYANERNPGANPNGLLDNIVELEDAYIANPLQRGDYENLIAGGVCPVQKDRSVGWWLVDGVTSVNPTVNPTRVPMKRRRMADEIEDTISEIAGPFNKEPATQDNIDAFTAEVEAYLEGVLSPTDPSHQRINGYVVDPVSGNTEDLLDLGIFTLLVSVKTLSDFRDIIIQATIGETVTLPAAA